MIPRFFFYTKLNKLLKFLFIFSFFYFFNDKAFAGGAYSLKIHYLSHIDYFDIPGYFFLLLNFVLLVFLIKKKPHLKNVLIIFLLIRIILIFINVELFSLPDSAGDAFKFVRLASEMANNGLYENIVNPQLGTYFKHSYSWLLALFFSIFGESYLLASSITLALSMLMIFILEDLLKLLWGNLNFNKILFLVTLMPSLMLYSVLPLREVVFIFTLLIAFLNAGLFLKYNKFFNLIISIIFFFITGTIHGGGNIGLILFILYLAFRYSKSALIQFYNLKINIFNLTILIFLSLVITSYLNDNLVFSKIGSFSLSMDPEYLRKFADQRTLGDAAYPIYLIPSSDKDLIWIIPLKFLYFLFGPFIWDIKSSVHFVGFFEGLVYMYLVYNIIFSFKKILNNDFSLFFLICLIFYVLAFSIGTSNFGTGFRHRTKFFIFIVSLAAPYILKKNSDKR